MSEARQGVLLTAFGGPDSLDAVGPFMAGLMHREPPQEVVARAQAKYEAIGGKSPLTDIAQRIAEAVEVRLAEIGSPVPVRIGMRYWNPYIADAAKELAAQGAEHIVMASLSAFESKVACGAYREAAHAAVAELDVTGVCEVPSLHQAAGFRTFLGDSLRNALDVSKGSSPLVVMTAHSLPESDLVQDDPYVAGLMEVSSVVAQAGGLGASRALTGDDSIEGVETFGSLDSPTPWVFAYQSKGARPGAWLEPDLEDVIIWADESGYDEVVVCPVGFATDHMETLYDLDIVARQQAEDRGLGFVRAAVPNGDPLLIDALVELLEPYLAKG